MFNLFRTEKNPKGPSLKRIQHLSFDLVDSKLRISLPYSNDTFGLGDQLAPSLNIYETNNFEEASENFSYASVLHRSFEYSRFNHRAYGSTMVKLSIWRCNSVGNLFEEQRLLKVISSFEHEQNKAFNAKASKNCQMSITQDFEFIDIGNEKVLCYGESQIHDVVPRLIYCKAISPNHYFNLSFKHLSVKDTEEVWFKMAKELEQKILSTVKLELNDAMLALKEDSKKKQ